jgi:hypothetical protein
MKMKWKEKKVSETFSEIVLVRDSTRLLVVVSESRVGSFFFMLSESRSEERQESRVA